MVAIVPRFAILGQNRPACGHLCNTAYTVPYVEGIIEPRSEGKNQMAGSSIASNNYNVSVAMEFFRFAGKQKAFAKGKKIFTENQRGIPFLLMPNRMYLLLDGEVGIFARDKPVGTIRPGQIFGEMASIDQGPRTGTALARTTCRVIALDDRQLRAALGRYPEFALMLMSVMIGRLRESIGRISSDSLGARTKWMQPAPLRKDLIEDLGRVLGPEAHLSFDSGDTILREGQVGVLMYVVLKGKVEIRAAGNLLETVTPGASSVKWRWSTARRASRARSPRATSSCSRSTALRS